MDWRVKYIYCHFLQHNPYPYRRTMKKFWVRMNIKRKPKRAKREELEKLYIEIFYK